MSLKVKSCLLASLLMNFFPFTSRAAETSEKSIPAGWELSATLALFRNMPFLDSSAFPPSQGDVYYSHSDEFRLEGTTQIFDNTYRFYRQTKDGKFLEITVLEEQHTGETGDGGFYQKVADISRSLKTVNERPRSAELRPDLSKLLGYIFDHRPALLVSKAGEMAKELNYGVQGRNRTPDYSQPRVSFLQDNAGEVEQIRIMGLASLLSPSQKSALLPRDQALENPVLQISVNASGAAEVSFASLSLR